MDFKILSIFFLLISLSLQKRILKEEKNPNEEEKSCEEEEESTENSENIDFSKISPSKIRKENMPHSQVLLPIRRTGTSNMQMGEGPCAGIEKKSANTLTTKGASINVIWEILVPEHSGFCTVKLSNGRQENEDFKILKPVDEEIYEDGSFICGREKGFEHKEFILPENYECDGCTLQWKWSTSYGDIYSCSDIIINGGSLSKCMGKCLNGGSCFNGECLCVEGFSGEFCEDEKNKSSSKTWLWILLLIICLIGLGYLGYKYDIINKFKDGWLKKDDNNPIKNPFHENSSQRMQPEYSSNPEMH